MSFKITHGFVPAFVLIAAIFTNGCSSDSDSDSPGGGAGGSGGSDSNGPGGSGGSGGDSDGPGASSDLMGGSIQKNALSLTGTVTVLAGAAYEGISDPADGTGEAARFCALRGITTDGANLYVPDCAAIRKIVIATGEVTTIAGSAIMEGSADGVGAEARFYGPSEITTDGANLYVIDKSRLRQIELATAKVTTLATGLGNVPGITTDNKHLYFADHGDGTQPILKFDPASGEKTVVVRGELDAQAILMQPDLLTTNGESVYVFSSGRTLVKADIDSGELTTVAGQLMPSCAIPPVDGSAAEAQFCTPSGMTSDGTNLYIVDGANTKFIRKIVIASGEVTTLSLPSLEELGRAWSVTTDGKSLFATVGRHIVRID